MGSRISYDRWYTAFTTAFSIPAKGDVVKGINFLSRMVRYDDFSFPIGYEIIKKDIEYCDIKMKQHRRKATVNKNQHFRQLVQQACSNHVLFEWVLADNWFGSKANIQFTHHYLAHSESVRSKKLYISWGNFVFRVNRYVSLTHGMGSVPYH